MNEDKRFLKDTTNETAKAMKKLREDMKEKTEGLVLPMYPIARPPPVISGYEAVNWLNDFREWVEGKQRVASLCYENKPMIEIKEVLKWLRKN